MFTEFHGQLGCSLPTRRLVLRNEDYYIKIRPSLESWLQKLLTRPEFRHSKLILDFIRNDERLVRVLKPYPYIKKYLYSGSFGSSLIESSISLNRFTQPINKVIANKKSPHLIGSLIQTSKMKYSSPDKNWNQPPNSVENYNIKRDLYQYLSDTNQLKDRLPNSFNIFKGGAFTSKFHETINCR